MIATCPDTSGTTAPNCSWNRKLCVSCSTNSTDGYVYIRVQTNNLPNHCYGYHDGVTMKEKKLDFSVRWNPSTTSLTKKTFSSQSDLDNTACYANKSANSNIPSNSVFSLTKCSGCMITTDTLVGVSINGIFIYSSTSDANVDPYYPAVWTG